MNKMVEEDADFHALLSDIMEEAKDESDAWLFSKHRAGLKYPDNNEKRSALCDALYKKALVLFAEKRQHRKR